MINCLRISEIYEEVIFNFYLNIKKIKKIIIITSAEDELIKIWDTKFN